ncbi:MAG: SPOR domain-containing protein [Bacteroidia bacterium]
MKRLLFLFFLVFAGHLSLVAQTASDSLQKDVHADPRLQTLVGKHEEVNAHSKEKGYRVQIYFGADKTKANEFKARFLGRYSGNIKAYEVYEVPNFKIRVGDFRSRMEAYRFLKKIKSEFPSAFIVESDIEYPE